MSRNCESGCAHSLELEFLNEKYREVVSHNNALRDQLSSRMLQDPVKYLKLCEELTKERNELKQQLTESEYEVNQVLSERDTVLKENQSLFDKNDSLRKELEKVLKSRDDYVKESESLRQKLDVIRSRSEFMQSNDDLFSSKMNLEAANQEIDKLKKIVEKCKSEAQKAMQESEIAKGRRDWAITEREKIVQERDSVRNLCDELRKERDTATSKLLAAIRDKDEAVKKIEQLNERIDAISNVKKAMDSHDHHKKQRNDSEDEIEVDVSRMHGDIGLNIDCGNENSDYNGNSFYPQVVYVEPGSVFYGKLHTNDYIRFVNGIDCSTLSQRMLYKTIRTSAPSCKMTIKRSSPILKGIYNVQLQLSNNSSHGIIFDTGVYVADIEPNSAAYYEPLISVGDRVLQINEKSVEGINNVNELNQIIMNVKNSEKVALKIMKDGKIANGWSKMKNCSSQTDSSDLRRSVENSFFPVVPFMPSASIPEPEVSLLNTSMGSSSPNSSKSTSSKLFSSLQQKFRKFTTNKDNQESDAIAVLDSVLNSQDSLDTAQEKTKSKHKKDIAKSWPRAGGIMVHDNVKSHSGTVVINRKKVRPRLYQIETGDQPNQQLERKDSIKEKITPEQQKFVNTLFAPPPPPVVSRNSNRNSNPLPINFMKRAQVDAPRQTLPNPGNKSPMYMGTIYEPQTKTYNLKRFSLNLSSSATKSHFNSFIPIKTSNSIESTTMSKSPMETPKEDGLDFTSPKMNKYFSNYSSSSKYECNSDGENLSSSGGVSQQDSLNNTSIGTLHSHSRIHSIGRVQASPSSLYASPPLASRYASPLPFPPNDARSPSHDLNSSSLHNSQNSSIDYPIPSRVKSQLSREEVSTFQSLGSSSGSYVETGTYPRNKAIRMPANQVGIPIIPKPTKISNNSLDYCGTPDRASPMPTFRIQIVKQGRNVNVNKRNSMPDYGGSGYKPNIGEKRRIDIEKSDMTLGISIRCKKDNRGVFVSHVNENSIASQVGLQIGDQLLEFCGINMRSATYELAAKFLRQCGDSITMLVQYNPEKFDEWSTSDENVSRSDDSTPQNSPKINRSVMSTDAIQSIRMSSMPPQESSHSTGTLRTHRQPLMSPITQVKSASMVPTSSSHMTAGNTSTLGKEQPRMVYIETRKNPNLGVSLLGGNAYGIFIHSVQKDSIADDVGLRVGDQILEYNGTDLRRATAEYAAFELAKPNDKVSAVVQYNIQKFNQIKSKPGDSFYIRVGFERNAENTEAELSFNKDDVLYVDNTMFRGVSGQWTAWKLDEYGCRLRCGIIPSQMKVEEELRLLGDSSEGDASSSRRSATSARRSFFKRIKPQRGSSRDSKELASFSNTHLSLYLEPSVDNDSPVGYQRVERLEYKYRPVLVIGALSEWVVDKLIIDFPEQFHRCIVNQMRCSKEEIEMRLNNNSIIEYRRRGSLFECVSLQAVKDNKASHCILDVNLSAVERLHRNQIYPIVLLLKFKSAKQIKDIKESRYGTATMFSTKQAKEMYEHALKLESEYRQYISVVIQGVNITHMSTQIKTAVDVEQKKILWVPRSS